MSNEFSDPMLLFTPPNGNTPPVETNDFEVPSTPQDHASNSERDPDATDANTSTSALASYEKRVHKKERLHQPSPDSDEEAIVAFVGEYRLGTDHFLYARYKDGLCRRKTVREFRADRPDLYAEYENAKEEGTLERFDPSASYVVISDRIPMTNNNYDRKPKAKRAKAKTTVKRSSISNHDDEFSSGSSDSEHDSDDGDHVDEYNDQKRTKPRRKGLRETITIKIKKKGAPRDLPFSPKKTRSSTGIKASRAVYDESEDDVKFEEQARTSTRATRSTAGSRKVQYTQVDDDDYSEDIEPEEKPVKKTKKKVRAKASRPAYGQVRVVADLYDSDPETAPLRAHRDVCEKCHNEPAHVLLTNLRKKKGRGKDRKRKYDEEDEEEDEEERFEKYGGWVRCLKCCIASHWSCLAATQRAEILKAAREKDKARNEDDEEPQKREGLGPYQTTEFICSSCTKGGICMVCHDMAVQPDLVPPPKSSDTTFSTGGEDSLLIKNGDTLKEDDNEHMSEPKSVSVTPAQAQSLETPAKELAFRCFTCKRLAHYAHLSINGVKDLPIVDVAVFYQEDQEWQCFDCSSYTYPLDKIIAWRPYPRNAVEPLHDPKELPNYLSNLPREYLVKWMGRSYRRTQWVPHMWLLSTSKAKLRNFLTTGPKIGLTDKTTPEDHVSSDELVLFATGEENSRDVSLSVEAPPAPIETSFMAVPDAESRLPSAWKTVDRVLDVLLWRPGKQAEKERLKKGKQKKGKGRGRKSAISGDEDEEGNLDENLWPSEVQAEFLAAFQDGKQPSEELTETVEEREYRIGERITLEEIDKVVWAFIKWEDLGYDEATWDSPPRRGDPGFAAFEDAFNRFLASREVQVKKMGRKDAEKFETRNGRKTWDSTSLGIPETGLYDIGQDKKMNLMDFQVLGVNWLCRNWYLHQQCILADEMGLGKTVQIVTFLGLLVEKQGAFPALVVVPNSTITNWVREFARWAPKLRVVPYFGEANSREIIKDYELYHSEVEPGTTGAKYHVLVTTYDMITLKLFDPVFKSVPRWETLVVDEGQRLKSDSSLLFKRLNELKTFHRIIMTGTPLNNNIRELFNLMNFLDPAEWGDLEALEKDHEELNEELIKDLHERLRPYFLRRVKADVLKLPPKNEVIVPVTMAPLQKEVYKSILSQNVNLLRNLSQISSSQVNRSAAAKSSLKNMLMQLRKCLQHPYLIADDIEPKGLTDTEAHAKLIDGSAKLRLLKMLLPKLKARRHRVLLFSQFVIALNIIEDFLTGEGFKFLRLDGSTSQVDRQASMDDFNREGSDVFIFILSTRAGGVGINLWSADTVIIFDPDFNPHQDLQAIARSHRYGQTKTCLVFKLMVKDSAEERIVQTGKKKLVLDHLIVQKMDDDVENGGNVQSILTFGAKALFEDSEEHSSRDIGYTDNDVEQLIDKIEREGDQQEPEESSKSFAFAKVWSAHKDSLEELPGEGDEAQEQTDSWAQTLAKIAAQNNQVQTEEAAGRGVRRRAAQAKTVVYYEGSPEKPKGKGKTRRSSKSSGGSDTEFNISAAASVNDSDDDDQSTVGEELADRTKGTSIMASFGDSGVPFGSSLQRPSYNKKGKKSNGLPSQARTLSSIHTQQNEKQAISQKEIEFCGLCGKLHGHGECIMTQNSRNLAEYREMLMIYGNDEPWEQRLAAIRSIDQTLLKRGHMHLIQGQPLKLLDLGQAKTNAPKPKKSRTSVAHVNAKQPTTSTPSTLTNFTNGDSNAQKRSASPSADLPVKKRAKHGGVCSICGRSPHHLAVDCPVVAKGSKSVMKAIARLSFEGGHSNTISILNVILDKQKKRESVGQSTSTIS